MKNVVLVTNMWDEVPHDVGEARERELSSVFFRPVLDLGAQMVRHHDTAESAHDIIRRIMGNRPIVLQIQQELVDEQKDIVNTVAGEAINRELNRQIRRHQLELEGIQEEMAKLLAEDEQTRWELEGDRRMLREQVEEIKNVSEEMAVSYAAEKERTEAKMKRIEQETEGLHDLAGTLVTIPIYK